MVLGCEGAQGHSATVGTAMPAMSGFKQVERHTFAHDALVLVASLFRRTACTAACAVLLPEEVAINWVTMNWVP
eukprot:919118-Pelagomonas_calceolata.AAC.5